MASSSSSKTSVVSWSKSSDSTDCFSKGMTLATFLWMLDSRSMRGYDTVSSSSSLENCSIEQNSIVPMVSRFGFVGGFPNQNKQMSKYTRIMIL